MLKRSTFLLLCFLMIVVARAAQPENHRRQPLPISFSQEGGISSADGQLQLAHRLEKMGRFEAALQMYRRLFKEDPRDRGVLEGLERVLIQLKRYEELVSIGDSLVIQDRLDKAREIYERAKDLDPKLIPVASFRLAELYYFQGNFQQVKALCERLIKGSPQGDYVNDALGMILFLQENLSDARGRETDGRTALKAFAKAELFRRQRRYNDALAQLEGLMKDFPNSELVDDALFLMAEVEEEMGNYQDALNNYRRLISNHSSSPLRPESQKRIGEAYEKSGDLHNAIQEYRAFLLHFPESILAGEVRRRVQRLRDKLNGEKLIKGR
ncbi:MAG TPA: tetratricopeptide repeat protein [Candidatus Latescibacteria bacterium]|nr:tetratricopeptide repeat protein [Candidatus Latescibacterota bacterium]